MAERSDFLCVGISGQRIRIGPFPMTHIVRIRHAEDSDAYLFAEELPSIFQVVIICKEPARISRPHLDAVAVVQASPAWRK